MAKENHDRQRPKPTISHQERLNRLGVLVLYGWVVRDYGGGSRQKRPARMGLRCDRGDLRRWRTLRGAPNIFESTLVAHM